MSGRNSQPSPDRQPSPSRSKYFRGPLYQRMSDDLHRHLHGARNHVPLPEHITGYFDSG